VVLALAILLAPLQPACAQSSGPTPQPAAGLPSASPMTGTPRRLPDGSVAVAAPEAEPAKAAPVAAPKPDRGSPASRGAAAPAVPSPGRGATSSAVAGAGPLGQPGYVPDLSLVIPDNVPTVTSNINNAPDWQAAHDYRIGDTVVNGAAPRRGYRAVGAGTSAPTGGPSGKGQDIADGGVTWKYLSDVDFRSITAWIDGIPKEAVGAGCVFDITMQSAYVGMLWRGMEYVDDNPGTALQFRNINGGHDGCGEGLPNNWNIATHRYWITLTAAPGESFADKGPSIPLAYDPANGVAIRSSVPDTGFSRNDNSAIYALSFVKLQRLQVRSDRGNGIYTCCGIIEDDLIDAAQSGLQLDYRAEVHNLVIIARGQVGMTSTYNNLIDHVTIVNPNGTGLVGVEVMNPGMDGPSTVRNTAIFGFKYPTGISTNYKQYPAFSTMSDHNASDAPVASGQNGDNVMINPLESGRIQPAMTAAPLPGEHSLSGVSFSAATFNDPKGDFRLAAGSRLRGAGALGSPLSLQADILASYPFLLQFGRNFSAAVPLLRVSLPPLYYGAATNPLLYPGMLVSGPGMPEGTIVETVLANRFLTGDVHNDAYLNRNATVNQTGATFRAGWEALEDTDIVGTRRASGHDIGAWQYPGSR